MPAIERLRQGHCGELEASLDSHLKTKRILKVKGPGLLQALIASEALVLTLLGSQCI